MNKLLEKNQVSALQMIKQLLVMEGKAPFTLHEPALATYKETILATYKNAWWKLFPVEESPQEVEQSVSPDLYDQALIYMAIARGYFLGSFSPFSILNSQKSAHYTFSCIQALYGHGSYDD